MAALVGARQESLEGETLGVGLADGEGRGEAAATAESM